MRRAFEGGIVRVDTFWFARRSSAAILFLVTGLAAAQDYPARPVTILVPWNAGGNIDLVARVTAQSLQKQTGRNFLVENAPGAGSLIGTTRAANAKPDGYTLLWGSSSAFVILPHLSSNVRYHPVNSFEPVSWAGGAAYVLVVNAESPVRTLRELISQLRASPGKLSYGTPGTGSSPHVTNEAMLSGVQARALHVPFKGSQDMVSAVLRRDIDWIFDFSNAVMPHVKAGKFRAIAVSSAQRLPALPGVPAAREEPELPGFEALSWMAVFAPKGIAADQVRTLNRLLAAALKDPEVVSGFAAAGFSAESSTPEVLTENVRREFDKWGEVIRKNNIRVE
jgi:tripartite-type tricarboxylate transporter receptor subunit TctC